MVHKGASPQAREAGTQGTTCTAPARIAVNDILLVVAMVHAAETFRFNLQADALAASAGWQHLTA